MRRLLLASTISIVGLIALGACSQEQTESLSGVSTPTPNPSSTSAAPAPQETATPEQEWQDAVVATQIDDSVEIEIQLITNVEGFERVTSGAGYVEMGPGFGDISWTDDLGLTREVLTSNGHFLELDGTWFAIEREGALPTTVAFDPLQGLESATDVVRVGPDDVLGVATIRYDAELDAGAGPTTMGFSEEELTVFSSGSDASLIATIWVDGDGRIVRLLRDYQSVSIDGDPISATSMALLDQHGSNRPIDVPETADALPAPM